MKKIGETTVYVEFSFGSYVEVGVNLYEGMTLDECIKLRSDDIVAYYDEDIKGWVAV